jgi:hypothetical protein
MAAVGTMSIEESIVFGSFGLSIGVGNIIGGVTQIVYGTAPGDDYIFSPVNGWSYRLDGSGGLIRREEVAHRLNYDTISSLVIIFKFPENLLLYDIAKSLMINFQNPHINGINVFYANESIKHIHRDGSVFADYHGAGIDENDIVKNVSIEVSKEFYVG